MPLNEEQIQKKAADLRQRLLLSFVHEGRNLSVEELQAFQEAAIASALRSVHTEAIEDDAILIEQLEREQHDAVGNPMIKSFTPFWANKLRERKLPTPQEKSNVGN